MLNAQGISYRYSTRDWLMEKLSISINAGEIVGLFGYSGSGKTTLAKIMAGYLQPYEGLVTIDGNSMPTRGVHPVQLVWQHPEKVVNPRWRLEDTLKEGGEIDGGILEALEIKKEWLRRWPSELSGGELQRICLARALGPNTRYIIADEMTTMLDALTQAQIWHTVLQIAEQRQIGVLSISHDLHLLQRISNRVINFNEIAFEK
jgi:ABC-type dipeptide/oligopeptide/nickel transport system ATPase subunit